MTTPITLERDGNVALIYINNPPVNAGSLAVRTGLLNAISEVAGDAELIGAVIIGQGRVFIAGSDLKEFGKPLEQPELPAVIEAIERCPKPIMAALHGAALGGGFELALGCDARIAMNKTVVGLPEVTLGMIPGAGGTQRLPRLIGIPRAIEMICSGARIDALEALDLGIVDAVVEDDLRGAAVTFLRNNVHGKRRVRDLLVPPANSTSIDNVCTLSLKLGRHRPQVQAAIAAVLSTNELPVDEALAREREVFQSLRLSREAFALRHLFFAERESAKLDEIKGIQPALIHTVAVIGAGTMGTGIALALLKAGLKVVLLDQTEAALTAGMARIKAYYAQLVSKDRLSQARATCELDQLESTGDWTRISRAQLVIEAVFEDLTVKRNLLRRVEPLLADHVLFASNTSYLDIDAIAEVAKRPQNVLGLHFFSPANAMRLIEVVRSMYTAPDTLAAGFAFTQRLGKLPILANNGFGFIGNRIYSAYRQQCELMLEEGALPAQIDAAMEAFGFAMGPFAVADMSGLDIALRMRQATADRRDPRARYVEIPDHLCALQRLGRKTGMGYYRYDERMQRSEDPEVTTLIEQASRDKGIERRRFTAQQIVKRALMAMVNEAALLLAEGVTTRVGDVDLVMVNGFGFPRWEGGPAYWAAQQELAQLNLDQQELAQVTGYGFIKGDLALFHHMHSHRNTPISA